MFIYSHYYSHGSHNISALVIVIHRVQTRYRELGQQVNELGYSALNDFVKTCNELTHMYYIDIYVCTRVYANIQKHHFNFQYRGPRLHLFSRFFAK